MKNTTVRPIAFVIASTNHGAMLVNRQDYLSTEKGSLGVGYQLLNRSSFDPEEIDFALNLLRSRRVNYGDGIVAIDCGANIGAHTIEWARLMCGWGEVIAFEAQERLFYALAGNIALNNCFNARAVWAAVGEKKGSINVPIPDYCTPSSFGSLELRKNSKTEFIGQEIDYSEENCVPTQLVAIDDLEIGRLDFIKIDIEGMEMEALTGAENSLNTFKPQLMIEHIKSDRNALISFVEKLDYQVFPLGINMICIHKSDPTSKLFKR